VLDEGPQALLPFVARAALRDPSRRLGAVGSLEHEALRVASRPWPRGAQLAEQPVERAAEIVCHLVYQPDTQGRRRIEALARDEVPSRGALPDLAQREGGDDGGDDAELHLGEAEHGLLVRDRDVGACDEARAAAEGVTLHDCDDRGGAAVDRLQHAAQRCRVGDVFVLGEVDRLSHPVDVRPGAEARSVPGQYDGPRGADVDERLRHVGDESGVERVARLGAGEREPQHLTVPFDAQRTHAGEHRVVWMLRGAIAAAVTPLTAGGESVGEGAIGPYADFLHAAGLDGVLTLGTNGEGILFSVAERRRVTERFVEASNGRLLVAAHCGAQTTTDTVSLAEHAAAAGADAVAVIGPPYFKLDPAAQRAHLLAAAEACAPVPFYVYEFAATAGYAFDPEMLRRLRDEASNVVGLKVSDMPWESFERYLLDGLDVFVGPESLIHRGLEAGAVGAVSALASAFPAEVGDVVRNPTEEGAAELAEIRAQVERFPRQAALKHVLGRKGVAVGPDVRPPLRGLTENEVRSLDDWLDARVPG
jgi:dihydrodipicolinate synthase/N-acetylneuraminate lyase